MSLWVDKYKPKILKEIIGNKLQIKKCELWLSNFKNKREETKSCLIISGSPGIGKTTVSNLLLKKHGYDVLEFNASDTRNQKLIKENFNNILGKTSISTMMGGNKFNGIIMDEIDGLSLGDRGGLSELLTYINPKKNKNFFKNPIICISNNSKDKKIKELKRYSEHISFVLPKSNELFKFAQDLNDKENMNLSEDYLLKIVNHSQNDVRKLVSILELFNKKKNENIDNFLSNLDTKNQNDEIYNIIFKLLNSYSEINNMFNQYLKEPNINGLLIHHNILGFIKNYKLNNKEKLKVIEYIYKSFCEGDFYDYHIFYQHYYELFEYNCLSKAIIPSYLLNKCKKLSYNKFTINDIEFSNLLNKFSLQLYNYKTKSNLLRKLDINSYCLNNDEVFEILIRNIIKYLNNYKINEDYNNEILKFIRYYNLDISDLEKIYKLIKNKIKKTTKENYFESLANSNIDKKYLNKIIKLI